VRLQRIHVVSHYALQADREEGGDKILTADWVYMESHEKIAYSKFPESEFPRNTVCVGDANHVALHIHRAGIE